MKRGFIGFLMSIVLFAFLIVVVVGFLLVLTRILEAKQLIEPKSLIINAKVSAEMTNTWYIWKLLNSPVYPKYYEYVAWPGGSESGIKNHTISKYIDKQATTFHILALTPRGDYIGNLARDFVKKSIGESYHGTGYTIVRYGYLHFSITGVLVKDLRTGRKFEYNYTTERPTVNITVGHIFISLNPRLVTSLP